jgi:esterase/lipase superfamily enzyme
MLRQWGRLTACLGLLMLMTLRVWAAEDWVRVGEASFETKAGTGSVDLSGVKGSFKAFRVEVLEGKLPASEIKISYMRGETGVAKVSATLKNGERSPPLDVSATGRFPQKMTLTWTPSAPDERLRIAVFGLQRDEDRTAVLDQSASQPRSVKPKPADAKSPAQEPAPSGGSRGSSDVGGAPPEIPQRPSMGSPPPPAPAPSGRPQAPSPESAGATAKPNVCTDQNLCTLVEVFFGTNRAASPATTRLNFGAQRAKALTLGHAFVTVPKANRARGSIPVPGMWERLVLGVPAEGDPARHFTIPKNGVSLFASEADFVAAAKKHMANAGDYKDHAFIFVHGFYVSFDNAVYRTAQIAYDLSPDGRPFGTAFLYSWPSAGDPTAYVFDKESAEFAAPQLQSFIRTVVDKTGAKNVHIIAHSMGNVALIQALQQIAKTETKAKINQIILAAPDFDKTEFEDVLEGVKKVATAITLYASKGDYALGLSRRAHKGTPRAGEATDPPGPALVGGIDTIDVSAISTSAFSWGHDSYADSKELLADIARIFLKGDRPPTKRNPNFKVLQKGTIAYWQYVK